MLPTARVLFERDRELDILVDARRDAAAGDGAAGRGRGRCRHRQDRPPGDSAAPRRDEGFTVLTSRASELERQYAFGVVRQLFETGVATDPRWSDDAGAVARPAFQPGTGEIPPFDDVSLDVLHGLYWLVANASAERPVLLIVDDVQWCDRPSSRFIAFLGRRLEGLRVLVLLGFRTLVVLRYDIGDGEQRVPIVRGHRDAQLWAA